MHAVCIARHRFLAGHFCSVFGDLGLDCIPAVGFDAGVREARARRPSIVICDYDVLVSAPLRAWEADALLADVPIIAVSLTRRPNEAHVVDANGIAGFLYLPTLRSEDALRIVNAAIASRIGQGAIAPRWSGDRERAPALE